MSTLDAVPIISREVDALAEHFKNYTGGPGFDVLRLVEGYRHYVAEVDAKNAEIARLRNLVDLASKCRISARGSDAGTALKFMRAYDTWKAAR